jgi:putative aldouronate transport system permease protein
MSKTAELRLTKGLRKNNGSIRKNIYRNWDLYLLIFPVVAFFLIFEYWPMYGVQIAFKDFVAMKGIWGSEWVGMKHFMRFFDSYYFMRLIMNTIGISLYQLIIGFPAPIILALMINEVRNPRFKKAVQTITYAPHFISTVVLIGMLMTFLSPRGLLNLILQWFGHEPILFMTSPGWFKTIFVFSGVWQNIGWNSIIYIAALASIDQQQYEAAIVDGASRMQRIWHISIPGIIPTAIILLILQMGGIMSVGFEKVFLMQNNLNIQASDVISTYVYRSGLLGADFSYSTAVGLFNSIINFVLLAIVNSISKRLSQTSLW